MNIITVTTKLLQISALEAHICKTEAQIDTLLHRLNSSNDIIRHMKQEVILELSMIQIILPHFFCISKVKIYFS